LLGFPDRLRALRIAGTNHRPEHRMITMTSAEAQSRFGELLDRSQEEPVVVTRRGRAVAYVLSPRDMQELVDIRKRREDAARWYAQYREATLARRGKETGADDVTDETVDGLVHELR
jgi:antitoxin Phd